MLGRDCSSVSLFVDTSFRVGMYVEVLSPESEGITRAGGVDQRPGRGSELLRRREACHSRSIACSWSWPLSPSSALKAKSLDTTLAVSALSVSLLLLSLLPLLG